jgi:hypothetical protein
MTVHTDWPSTATQLRDRNHTTPGATTNTTDAPRRHVTMPAERPSTTSLKDRHTSTDATSRQPTEKYHTTGLGKRHASADATSRQPTEKYHTTGLGKRHASTDAPLPTAPAETPHPEQPRVTRAHAPQHHSGPDPSTH